MSYRGAYVFFRYGKIMGVVLGSQHRSEYVYII